MRNLCVYFVLLVFASTGKTFAQGHRLEFAWPTPNTAWLEGKPIDSYIQPTVSGDPISGCFGCVRSSGTQFHEGIDLKPIRRDRRGEAADPVFAVMPGVVRHLSARAGSSSYGRYIVIEHPDVTPAVYSLYAHLASLAPGLQVGDRVERGQTLGLMGRSAGGYTIPRERAHLHFELGLMITRDFQSWYVARKFGSPNEHGLWNGMNLMGFDPLGFFDDFKARRVDNFREYLVTLERAVRIRIATRRIPDFVQRYPSLVTQSPDDSLAGWEVDFSATGLPIRWAPLTAHDVDGYRPQEVKIIENNIALTKTYRCRSLVVMRGKNSEPGKDLQTVLQQLFGLR